MGVGTGERIGWGIIGTGKIARIFGRALAGSRSGRLVAVASRSSERARRFGQEIGAERCYGAYDELLADDAVEVVYIATPHPTHLEWGTRSAEAGKHVLCEKPLTVNRDELLVTHDRATGGVEVRNSGGEDLLVITFFGPDLNPDVPMLPSWGGAGA